MSNNRHQGNQGRQQQEESEFEDRVIHINRCAKVVKGGRRFSFSAIVVVGDKKGRVGVGLGKAGEVPEAIKKAAKKAKKTLVHVPVDNTTIPHEIVGSFGAARVVLRKAPEGTGVIASSAVRAILEAAGYSNIVTKSVGRDNPHNIVRATMDGLANLRTMKEIAADRGKDVAEIV